MMLIWGEINGVGLRQIGTTGKIRGAQGITVATSTWIVTTVARMIQRVARMRAR
jgi:hypothetical protein